MYPALAVLRALKDEVESVHWVGSQGGMEAELVERAGIPFQALPAAGVHGVGVRQLPGNLRQLASGYLAARRLLERIDPDVLFFTGGYVAVPVALARRGRPAVVFVPDIEPGLALKLLARTANQIAVSAPASARYLPNNPNLTVTGYPTRPELEGWTREAALEKLGLTAAAQTLLVFGGSKGARSINRAVQAVLPELLTHMQVVHITGHLDWPQVEPARDTLSQDLAARYRVFPYLHDEMGAALASADLVVSRAGASVLGEYPLFGLPAILVPYPHAWRYQHVNARFLAGRGAAEMLEDAALPDELLPLALRLMADSERRSKMRAAMLALRMPDAAGEIAALISNQHRVGEPDG